MRTAILETKAIVESLAEKADGLENKHLRDILRDAVGRLHDAAGHPDAEEKPEPFPGAQTGELNPMQG